MSWFPWLRRRCADEDLDKELRFHLERQIADSIAGGLPPEEARRQARLLFGGTEQAKEACRDVRPWHYVETLLRELRHALRSLRKSAVFSATVIVVLALGIGSNLAVFTLIDSLFLRPLPVDRPAELVSISSLDKNGRQRLNALLSKILIPLRDEPIFQGTCGFTTPNLTAKINDSVRSIGGLAMTGDCFRTLGVGTQIGRPFTLADDTPGAERVVVLTDSLWRTAFAADPNVLGKTVQANGAIFTIVGVAERRFTGLLVGFPPGLIVPLEQMLPEGLVSTPAKPIYQWASIFARKAPGISEEEVRARIGVLEKSLLEQSVPLRYNEAQRRDYFARRIVVSTAETGVSWMLRERFGKPLYAILGICALVLSIACVNLANLSLARGLRRGQEIAVRTALGASKASVGRLLSLESVLLVLAGSALGIVFAQWASLAALAQASEVFTDLRVVTGLTPRTAAFFVAMVLFTAAAFAVAPAWQAVRLHRRISLNRSGRGVIGSGMRPQRILLTVQLALTLALVSGGSAFNFSLGHLYRMNLGLKPEGLSAALLAPLPDAGNGSPREPYYKDLLRQIESVPDVASASLTDHMPFWTKVYLESIIGVESDLARTDLRAQCVAVSEHFFDTLGVPIVAGHGFRAGESESNERTVIVSQSLARSLGSHVIGRRIRIGNDGPERALRIVGIAGNAQLSLENPDDRNPLIAYVNIWQHPNRQRYPGLLIKTASSAPLAVGVVRPLIQSGGRQYVEHYHVFDELRDAALVENRWLAHLSTAFSVLALSLAAIGLFGLLSYHVASRTGEIGIRMALGAGRAQILGLLLRQFSRIMIVGLAVGVGLALAFERTLAGLIYGVGIRDPRLLGLSIAVLLVTALLAAYIPARRASSVDPLIALRHD